MCDYNKKVSNENKNKRFNIYTFYKHIVVFIHGIRSRGVLRASSLQSLHVLHHPINSILHFAQVLARFIFLPPMSNKTTIKGPLLQGEATACDRPLRLKNYNTKRRLPANAHCV